MFPFIDLLWTLVSFWVISVDWVRGGVLNNDGEDGDGDRENEVPMCVVKRVGEDQAEELSVAASAAEAEVANNPDNEDDVEVDNEDE